MKFLVLAALIASLTFACPSEVNAQTRKKRIVKTPKTLTLAQEGEAEGKKLANLFLTQCGESYFAKYGDEITEWRGIHVRFDHKTPSPAGKLNGVQWITDIKITFDVQRALGEKSWSDGVNMYSFRIIKTNGVWEPHYFLPHFYEDLLGPLESNHKLVCGDVLPLVAR